MQTWFYNTQKLNIFQRSKKQKNTFNLDHLNKHLIEVDKMILPQIKKEDILSLNLKIDLCLNNKSKLLQKTTALGIKDLYGKSSLIQVIKKQILFCKFGFKKQYFYQIIDVVSALSTLEHELFSAEVLSFFGSYVDEIKSKETSVRDLLFKSIFGFALKVQSKSIYSNLIWVKLYESFNILTVNQSFAYLSIFLTGNTKMKFKTPFKTEPFVVEKELYQQIVFKSLSSPLTLRTFIRRKHLFQFLMGGITNGILSTPHLNFLVFHRLCKKTTKQNLNAMYKQGSFGVQTMIRFGIKNKPLHLLKRFKYKQEISLSLLYFISKIEEKKELLSNHPTEYQKLVALRNFLLEKGHIKLNKNINFGLSTLPFFNSLYENENPENLYFKVLFDALTIDQKTKLEFTDFLNVKTLPTKNLKINLINSSNKSNLIDEIDLYNKNLWKQKKLMHTTSSNLSIQNLHKYFSLILGQNVSLIFINALALTKFAYSYPVKKKSPQRFLNFIEREMIQRYKYVAVYIQDFIRVCYLSFFLKKPTFVANFMGYQLAQLPRNRKETQFIRFLIKVIKIFGAQRPEIVAVKVEFKGRVNRWRRTKVIRGSRGVISFFRFNTRIEYGSGKAITRKGALGIRLWICYKWTFTPVLRDTLLSYIEYSQNSKAQVIERFLLKFQSKLKSNYIDSKSLPW